MAARRRSLAGIFLIVSFLPGLLLSSQAGVTAQDAATPAASPPSAEATPVAGATPTGTESQPAWLEIGPGGSLTARAVSDGSCPEIVIDDVAYVMDLRAEPSQDHPVTVCETTVPSGSESVLVGGTQLPLPATDPQRILLIGDTGCRMKADDEFQACNDPAAWPFATLAEQGAAWEPDLIIHIGDYLYRESPCPDGNEGCAGSPYGDTWATWEADFFAPAAPLLDAAPWVFMRGNHEDCERAGEGWFRYLDPRPMPTTCQAFVDPYAFEIGDVQAIVMDSASAGDISSTEEANEAFREQFAEVERLAGDGPAWLLTHRPFWSIADADAGAYTEWTTATYTEAGYAQPPAAIDIVISGHVHMSELLMFTEESGRPVQVISGNGGTSLESMDTAVVTGSDVGDETLVEGRRYREFGFVGMERVDTGWVITAPMVDGSTPLSCLTIDTAAACIP